MTWDKRKLASLGTTARKSTGRPRFTPDSPPPPPFPEAPPQESRLAIDAGQIRVTIQDPLRIPIRVVGGVLLMSAALLTAFLCWIPIDPGPAPISCAGQLGTCAEVFPEIASFPTDAQLTRAARGWLYRDISDGFIPSSAPMYATISVTPVLGLDGWDSARLRQYQGWRDAPDPDALLSAMTPEQRVTAGSASVERLAAQPARKLVDLVCTIEGCDSPDALQVQWRQATQLYQFSAHLTAARQLTIGLFGVLLAFFGLIFIRWRGTTTIGVRASRLQWNRRDVPMSEVTSIRFERGRLSVLLQTGTELRSVRGLAQHDADTLVQSINSCLLSDREHAQERDARRRIHQALSPERLIERG